MHPCGYLKHPEPSLNETPRWVGAWGRRGEWEQGEGQTKGMSSVCAREIRSAARFCLSPTCLQTGKGDNLPGELRSG